MYFPALASHYTQLQNHDLLDQYGEPVKSYSEASVNMHTLLHTSVTNLMSRLADGVKREWKRN